jgi:hypothetical protein
MFNRACRFRNNLDRLGEIGGLDHSETGDRQGGRHEGEVLRPDVGGQGVLNLHRRARDAHQGSAFFHLSFVGVGSVANRLGRCVVASSVAVPDRDELRHVNSPASSRRDLAANNARGRSSGRTHLPVSSRTFSE